MDPLPQTNISGSRERSRRLSHTLATPDSRTPTRLSDRSRSTVTPSPQPSYLPQQQHPTQPTSHLVHRFQKTTASHHTSSLVPSAGADSPLLRSMNDPHAEPNAIDAKLALSATSSYLQEKLLKERRVDSDRAASRMGSDKMPPSMDLRAVQSSPARAPFDISRPKSSTGHLDGRKKGVGLKEMEQTMTSMHKLNFDLKLELYHRRQKQASLEERCEGLEAEKRELEDINDKLMSELEMRDKAVEEAVAMIVSLEERLEELLCEREIAQNVAKEERLFASEARHHHAFSATVNDAATDSVDSFDMTPKAKRTDDTRALHRMPSFLSERSELTENLRSVYMGTRAGSLASLPRMAEDYVDVDARDLVNRIASPALSVLSESSFVSIYGKKGHEGEPSKHTTPTSAPLSVHERPLSPVACVPNIPRRLPEPATPTADDHINGSAAAVVAHALASTMAPPTDRTPAMPGKRRSNSTSTRMHRGASSFGTLNDFLGTNSPLQRLEKMEMSLQAMNDASQPGSEDERGEIEALARHLRDHELGKSYRKQEKRDSLRRVRTDGPFSRDLNGQHNLPPTPDTISTSTLRRYKNSNDTLSADKDAGHERSYLALSEESVARSSMSVSEKRVSAIESFVDSIPDMQPPSTSAFNSRLPEALGVRNSSSCFENRRHILQRPRSADETTISHRGRGSVWGDSESSDDDMDIDGNDSASLHDYWLRESLRPTGQPPAPSRSRAVRRSGRASPDLFGFPTTANGWATTTLFGTLGAHGYEGSAPLAQTLDALGDSLPTPMAGMSGPSGLLASPLTQGLGGIVPGPPPPPHRRSSLHAQTGHGSSSRSGSRMGSAPGTPSLGTPVVTSSVFRNVRRSPTRSGGTPNKDVKDRGASEIMVRNDSTDGRAPVPAPAQQQQDQAQTPLPKQRHYPPSSGANIASRSRVMSLFRRSGSQDTTNNSSAGTAATPVSSTGSAAAASSAPPSATEATFGAAAAAAAKNAPPEGPAMGIPSWVRRGGDGADAESGGAGASSTPPPILRNPRNPLRGSVDSGSACGSSPAMGDDVPATDAKTAPAAVTMEGGTTTAAGTTAPESAGGRKKWLGLGRVTSSRNHRAG